MADDKPITRIPIKDLISEDGDHELTNVAGYEIIHPICNGGDAHLTLCGPASVR